MSNPPKLIPTKKLKNDHQVSKFLLFEKAHVNKAKLSLSVKLYSREISYKRSIVKVSFRLMQNFCGRTERETCLQQKSGCFLFVYLILEVCVFLKIGKIFLNIIEFFWNLFKNSVDHSVGTWKSFLRSLKCTSACK